MQTFFQVLICGLLFVCCSTKVAENPVAKAQSVALYVEDTLPRLSEQQLVQYDYDTLEWTELIRLDSSIQLDIRYATSDNFVGEVLYQCPRCFLRPTVAEALLEVHQELKEENLGLKLFDCYRPRDVQWKLWEIMPKPGFVADPRSGSIHNRGGAVDLTIVKPDGTNLDMGTDFDFFGPAANHQYTALPDSVLANRQKLKTLLQKHGFSPIRSEWWHYNFRGERFPLEDEEWDCPNN